jgi:hypothetical protein
MDCFLLLEATAIAWKESPTSRDDSAGDLIYGSGRSASLWPFKWLGDEDKVMASDARGETLEAKHDKTRSA